MGKRFLVADEDLLNMYKEKGSIAETAIMCNASYSTIYKRLGKLNALPGREPIERPWDKQPVNVGKFIFVNDCQGGIAIRKDKLDKVLKLKEGMKVKVKSDDRMTTRKIEKIYKHHVLTKHPDGYAECFTKGEILMYNYKKKEVV
ncbi:MAG: hypothetical protein IKL53_01440 [Lachnospiraceae bacterium]|nr:hypothetical protein [Lachnospiraceae bacterium]